MISFIFLAYDKINITERSGQMAIVEQKFKPVYNENSKILILGTVPSQKSREKMFYYQHPRNRFWKVIAKIVQYKECQTIEEMKKMLLDNNIALWDVIKSCEITGSSDASIKDVVPADLSIILDNANIKQIFANGDKAFKVYMKYTYPITKRKIIKLPSTSPANASFSLERLVEEWSQIRSYLKD